MNTGIRVNKISVSIDKYDTRISLYKNNQLLGYLYADDIGIDAVSEYSVSVKAYQMYIKDVIINLLDNGGFEGYYYEPKQEGNSIKYDNNLFLRKSEEYVRDVIGDKYDFILTTGDNEIQADRYKNGYIKDAVAGFILIIKGYDIRVVLNCQIKSGQLCRPKTFEYDGIEYNFNITNINKIVKDI